MAYEARFVRATMLGPGLCIAGMTPSEEEDAITALLRDYGGIHPGAIGPVMSLFVLGLTNSAWRNTCVEDWHAEGRMHDGDMMRINSHTSWRLRQLVWRLLADNNIDESKAVEALDGLRPDAVMDMTVRMYGWFTNGRRKLPVGRTIADLAGNDLAAYKNGADRALNLFVGDIDSLGTRAGFQRMAVHGALACQRWWGHPSWPGRVSRFLSVIDDPADRHWGDGGDFRTGLPPEPPIVADRGLLRKMLLRRPWDLDSGAAAWIVRAGIGYIDV